MKTIPVESCFSLRRAVVILAAVLILSGVGHAADLDIYTGRERRDTPSSNEQQPVASSKDANATSSRESIEKRLQRVMKQIGDTPSERLDAKSAAGDPKTNQDTGSPKPSANASSASSIRRGLFANRPQNTSSTAIERDDSAVRSAGVGSAADRPTPANY